MVYALGFWVWGSGSRIYGTFGLLPNPKLDPKLVGAWIAIENASQQQLEQNHVYRINCRS